MQFPERPATRAGGGGVSAIFRRPRRTAQPWKSGLEKRDCITQPFQPGSNPSSWKNPEPGELPALLTPTSSGHGEVSAARARLQPSIITEYILFMEFYK